MSNASENGRVRLRVNGETTYTSAPERLLLDVLRQELGLTGTKCGCDDSSCGACTVLINGVPMLACTLIAGCCAADDDIAITTIEGIREKGMLNSLQRSFANIGGAQCGYCTPGMVMAAKAILDRNPNPSDDEIRAGLSGNICRCTGYMQIFASVRAAIHEQVSLTRAGYNTNESERQS